MKNMFEPFRICRIKRYITSFYNNGGFIADSTSITALGKSRIHNIKFKNRNEHFFLPFGYNSLNSDRTCESFSTLSMDNEINDPLSFSEPVAAFHEYEDYAMKE